MGDLDTVVRDPDVRTPLAIPARTARGPVSAEGIRTQLATPPRQRPVVEDDSERPMLVPGAPFVGTQATGEETAPKDSVASPAPVT